LLHGSVPRDDAQITLRDTRVSRCKPCRFSGTLDDSSSKCWTGQRFEILDDNIAEDHSALTATRFGANRSD
jgi:hypothetical protein